MNIDKLLNMFSCSTPRVRIAPKLVEMPLRQARIPDAPKPTQLMNFLEKKGIFGNVISRDVFEKTTKDVLSHSPVRPH